MTQQTLLPPNHEIKPEKSPLDEPQRPFVAEDSSGISQRTKMHGYGRRNWLITGISAVVLVSMLAMGMYFSSSSGSLPHSATSANHTNTMGNMDDTSSSTTTGVPHQAYNATLPAVPTGDSVNVRLVMKDQLIQIGPGVTYHAWTFNGTVPGPIIHVRQGQMVNATIVNQGSMPHSIDFHAAQTPWNINYQSIPQGKSFSFSFRANFPGVFMYHCGTPTVIYHMANGMYGTIIVDPAKGWGSSAQEYALVQSEFYTMVGSDGTYSVDPTKLMNGIPDYVVFNGYLNQYKDAPLTAKVGQKIRLFIMNAGPTQFSAFHVIGAIFSDTYVDGNPANHMVGNQTVMIPPGGGVMIELTIPEAGLYPFVTHAFADASKGALGVIKVTP